MISIKEFEAQLAQYKQQVEAIEKQAEVQTTDMAILFFYAIPAVMLVVTQLFF